MQSLILIEHDSGRVADSSLELIQMASQLNLEVTALVCALDRDAINHISTQLQGVSRLLAVEHDLFNNYLSGEVLVCLNQAVEHVQPDLVLMSYSTAGVDLAGGVAYAQAIPLVAYALDMVIDGDALKVTSQVYGGKVLARNHVSLPAVVTVMPGAVKYELEAGSPPEIIAFDVTGLGNTGIEFVGMLQPDSDGVDLTKADRIVCVGRALGGKEKLPIVEALAEALEAEVGGSRPVIDAGWLPKAHQVGKSGTKVKPKLYLMAGVSGAPEHLEGMQESDLIIALNSDEQAPIFNKAHYGAVCDMFNVLPALTERIKAGG
ncbi:electron transfer flavoprotein subunit alpha/FixB family protein [Vibrio penaeicida]|uniref:electron transfer flavoprotein subunit alpha/FixB family protein n=1 Tax=Vibrio penaeicida TaxID=104609 RepID=UPI000CEA0900|nr:electron transfer flavoprotein subunit alpha/FixB family protein [Vibrio penaeicida]